MRIAVLQFPGSNCERETLLALQGVGLQAESFLWKDSLEALSAYQGYVIVGGFSYQDRSRSGIIAALDPVITVLKAEAKRGKPILGICNGAQILIESGLFPGVALTHNKRMKAGKVLGTGYYNAWVQVKANAKKSAFNQQDGMMNIPVAHAEGRFIISDAVWKEIQADERCVFYYTDAKGRIEDAFPINPNGSDYNIAAISNKEGNVLAMMPHPERTKAGDSIFQAMKQYVSQPIPWDRPTEEIPVPIAIQKKSLKKAQELILSLSITDNEAFTVENTLHRLGFPVKVKRYTHWQIETSSKSVFHQVQASAVLYNERKEAPCLPTASESSIFLLVRAKEDILGLKKTQTLKKYFVKEGLEKVEHGVLWSLSAKDIDTSLEAILKTGILFNPLTHDGYEYLI